MIVKNLIGAVAGTVIKKDGFVKKDGSGVVKKEDVIARVKSGALSVESFKAEFEGAADFLEVFELFAAKKKKAEDEERDKEIKLRAEAFEAAGKIDSDTATDMSKIIQYTGMKVSDVRGLFTNGKAIVDDEDIDDDGDPSTGTGDPGKGWTEEKGCSIYTGQRFEKGKRIVTMSLLVDKKTGEGITVTQARNLIRLSKSSPDDFVLVSDWEENGKGGYRGCGAKNSANEFEGIPVDLKKKKK